MRKAADVMAKIANDWPARWAQAKGDKVAVNEPQRGVSRTWKQLDRNAAALARFLSKEAQVGVGDRVAFLGENRVEHADAFFAVARLRALLVPLNHKLSAVELARVVTNAVPKAIVTGGALAERARELALAVKQAQPSQRAPLVIVMDGVREIGAPGELAVFDYEQVLAGPRDGVPAEAVVEESDPWLVLYTSGSTGKPKGALVTHRQILWNNLHTTIACELGPEDTTVTYTPMFYTGGWNVLTNPLWHRGAKVHFLPAFDAGEILALVQREKLTQLFGVPTTLAAMRDHPTFAKTDLSSLRVVLAGGAACPHALIEAYGARGIMLRQGYGLTEVGPNCLGVRPEDALRKCGSIGRPNLHLECRVTDDTGREVVRGEEGELRLRGPTVFGGYLNNEQATQDAIDAEGFFRTGDIVKQDDEGQFWIVGRKNDMFKSGGEKVYAGEVEGAIALHEAVAEVVVLGVADEKWGEVGRAVIVRRPGKALEAEELKTWLQGRLAKFKVPKTVVFVDALPRLETGKIARPAVRAKYGDASAQSASAPAKSVKAVPCT